MDQRIFNKRVQQLFNDMGVKPPLLVDGAIGPKTEQTLLTLEVKFASVRVPPIGPTCPFWIEFLIGRLGWTEFDHDTELSKDWPLVGLNYKTVIGTPHAWCGLECASALHSGGVRFPSRAAGASAWSEDTSWSEPCGYISGAFLPIRHASGGRHITVFLFWQDEKNKVAACLGGNQNNGIRISLYNLSGNEAGHDEVVGGPVWPRDYPQTGYKFIPHGEGLNDSGGSTT